MDSSAYEMFKDCMPHNANFFPKLRSVTVGPSLPDGFTASMITPWLGLRVEQLKLDYFVLGPNRVMHWNTFSKCLPRVCPDLKEIYLSSARQDRWDTVSAGLFLANQTLSKITLDEVTLTPKLLEVMAGLSTLEKLQIKTSSIEDMVDLRLPTPGFSSLRLFSWSGSRMLLDQMLVGGFQPNGVQDVQLYLRGLDVTDGTKNLPLWDSTFTLVKRLNIQLSTADGECLCPNISWFQPLSGLSHLEDVTIRNECILFIKIEPLKALVAGWKRLQSLDLGIGQGVCGVCNDARHDSAALNIKSVETILDILPHLKTLRVVLKAEVPQTPVDSPLRFQQLQELMVWSSEIVEPASMAAYLSTGGLRALQLGHSYQSARHSRYSWVTTRQALQMLNLQRRHHDAQVKALEEKIQALQQQIYMMNNNGGL